MRPALSLLASKFWHCAFALLGCFCIASLSSLAAAQGTPTADLCGSPEIPAAIPSAGPCPEAAQNRDDAGPACRAGMQAFEAQKYEEAAEHFRRMKRLRPGGYSLRNLALTFDRLGKYQDALQTYRAALGAKIDPLSGAQQAEVATQRDALSEYFRWNDKLNAAVQARSIPDVMTAHMCMARIRPSALAMRGVAHAAFDLGHYEHATFAGEQALTEPRVPLTHDERVAVDALLRESRLHLATLTLSIVAPAATRVVASVRPLTPERRLALTRTVEACTRCDVTFELEPGMRTVQVNANGATREVEVALHAGTDVEQEVDLRPSAPPPPVVVLPPTSRWRPRLIWTAASVGVASALVGIGSFAYSWRKHNEYEPACPNRVCTSDAGAAASKAATRAGSVATAAASIGAAGLVTAAVVWLIKPKQDRPSPQHVQLDWHGDRVQLRAHW